MNFNKPTGCGNKVNVTQIDWEIYKKIGAEIFDFSLIFTWIEGQVHLNWY